jgi:penicillin-binding protein 1A
VIVTFIVVILFYYGRSLPSETTLLYYSPPVTTKVYSSSDELVEEYAIEHRVIIPFDRIPRVLKGAFIVAEDREFYAHSGISFASLLRAIVENTARKTWNKKPAGGSTITQQIAKNLLVGNARSLTRKFREAIMAFRIESTISKDKIFEIYLNQLYLGKGCYGIVEACDYYFGKRIEDIKPHEAAFLAAIPSAPSIYINSQNYSKILLKRNSILYQMYDMHYIPEAQLKEAIATPIKIKLRKNKVSSPYFSDEIFKIFSQIIPREMFLRCGYSITTTMDKRVQHCVTKALEDGLIEFTKTKAWKGTICNIRHLLNTSENSNAKSTSIFEKVLKGINAQLPSTINKITACVICDIDDSTLMCRNADGRTINIKRDQHHYTNAQFKIGDVVLCRATGPKSFELYQAPGMTGGIVVMDLSNGDILGMSGGYSFDISSFNCVTQAQRQPGSTIKPFIYAAAIEDGMDEYDIVEDKPVNLTLPSGEVYAPHNYSKRSYGRIAMRDGLIYSRNLSTVNLALMIGMPPINRLLKSAELVDHNVPISGVLGAVETTPLKLLTAFSAFFNGGIMIFPRFITNVEKSYDTKYLDTSTVRFLSEERQKKIMSKETAEIIKNMLHDAVEYGTARILQPLEEKYGIEIYGKTGTTNNFKDAWFVGAFTTDEKTYLVCVFVGYQSPRSLGEHASGSKVALPIFANFVRNFFTFRLA